MKTIVDSLPSLKFVPRPGLAMAIIMAGAAAGLAGCHKDEEPAKAPPPAETAQQAPAPPSAVATPKPAETVPAEVKPDATPAVPETGPTDKEVSQRVATFKAFHPYGTGNELLKMPQFASQLASILDATAKDPALMERVQAVAATPSELKTTGKPLALDLKISNYTTLFSDRLLAAVLSGQPRRLVNLVLSQPSSAEFLISAGPATK
ncbi:MAG: hypothetical protein JWO94_501 [Verrucomicrobiaceae bacterium]|nr:hypothetical protein [Verrucomicrobiaceae bacterium]